MLSRGAKIAVGVLTAWVTVYPLLFVCLIAGTMSQFIFATPDSRAAPVLAGGPFTLFFALFPLHFLTIFLMLGLQAFYLVHVIRNTVAAETARVLLGVGLFFLPYIAMPLYYYLYIWLEQPPAWAQQPAPPAPSVPG